MKVLLTGATGLIGRRLIHRLLVEGHEVRALARSPEKLAELPEENVFRWSDQEVPPPAALSGVDAVVHLAGEGIADRRWTPARMQRLWDSRVVGTRNLVAALAALKPLHRPKAFISGSAIGFYGSSPDVQDEASPAGSGFLADLCRQWERNSLEAEKFGARTVVLRTGLVLAQEGGLLAKTPPVVLGDGQQWMSWIHIEDMIRFILYALENQAISGPYNLTAPNPVRNDLFTKMVSRAKGYPLVAKCPAAVLKLVLGEMSKAVFANQRIIPKNAVASGFRFLFEDLQNAVSDLIGKSSVLDCFFAVSQFVPLERKQVFSFFSQAENLEILTPPWLGFHITKKSTPHIERGSLIDYKLKIHGVPVRWRTLISQWEPDSSFVDDQLKGPYKIWHHVHTFEPVPGGTLISDQVTFRVPGAILGKVLLLPFVRKDVREIFQYRKKAVRELCARGAIQ